jgi:formate--tetrahydrofolate ligase
MCVLLRDALMPNLVQTVEGVPAFVHGGPFANIAHGCNSVIATKMAMAHADWTVTEAGFGSDLGAEKFFDIKCASSGLRPSAVVLVATVRALKRHGGVSEKNLGASDAEAVERGVPNLIKHVENARAFGVEPVVALNRFEGDTADEIEVVRRACAELGVPFAESDHFARGGEGAAELARTVVACTPSEPPPLRLLYDWADPIEAKVEAIARTMYGADGVAYTRTARTALAAIESLGHGGLPVCMAKTPASLSDDPKLAGRPEGFTVTVSDFVVSAGAGFVVALLGDILRMPGLPRAPQAARIDLVDGEMVGVS